MTLNEIAAAHPEWTRKVVVEAWLHDCAREAGREFVEAEHGITLDDNDEADLTDYQADAIWNRNVN